MTRPYPPPYHVSEDSMAMAELVRRFPFATIASAGDPPAVSHLPLIWAEGGEGARLWTHIDRANPQLAQMDGRPVTVIFRGPDAYMSPDLFEGDFLPTWNYMIVECTGVARARDGAATRSILSATAKAFENLYGKRFSLEAKTGRVESLLPYICGVEITVKTMTGRFKLSQERPAADRERALAALTRRPGLDDDFQAIIRKAADLD